MKQSRLMTLLALAAAFLKALYQVLQQLGVL